MYKNEQRTEANSAQAKIINSMVLIGSGSIKHDMAPDFIWAQEERELGWLLCRLCICFAACTRQALTCPGSMKHDMAPDFTWAQEERCSAPSGYLWGILQR